MHTLTEKTANDIYDVLVQAGAREDDRSSFVAEMTSARPTQEWRFSGHLGFGGKYRPTRNQVDCYREDESPERLQLIEQTNERLRLINVVEDAQVFGMNKFVYCASHVRAHSTGWCTVPVSEKILLDAETIEAARQEVIDRKLAE